MGIKLITARTMLIRILNSNINFKGIKTLIPILPGCKAIAGSITNERINWLRIARRIFVIGPAAAEIAISLLGSLKFMGFMGTGFAYPKTNWPFEKINSITGMIIVPIKSICTMGLSVSLPINLAVGSPSLFATNPWDTS
jgi:hypothetical protein